MTQNYLKLGSWNSRCDICGFKFKSGELKKRWDGLMTCKDDFELRNMQDFVQTPLEVIAPPWTRPESYTFLPECTPNGISAVPGQAEPGCMVPGYLSIIYNPNGDWPPVTPPL